MAADENINFTKSLITRKRYVRFVPNFAGWFILTLSRNPETQKFHFSKSNKAADENANSTKELNNVKTVRPISINFGMKNPVATVYIIWYSKNDLTTKIEELERAQFEQVRQYFDFTIIAKGQLMGAC